MSRILRGIPPSRRGLVFRSRPAKVPPLQPVVKPRSTSPVKPAPVRAKAPSQPAQPQRIDRAPNAIPLSKLEAKLYKVVAVTTTLKETEAFDGDNDLIGKYVWKDEKGESWYWSDKPVRYEFHEVNSVAEADHVDFLCPLCFSNNGGPKGTHMVMVSFADRNIPEEAGSRDCNGKPSRWKASGHTADDLVLSPSILLGARRPANQGCHWHGWVGMNGAPPGYAR